MDTNDIDVKRRRPVWEAISDLWRDTELQDYEIEHIAKVLAESRYTQDELHEIYAFEVAPVVWRNLMTAVPPVWAGFDNEWLREEILKVIERQGQNIMYRCHVRNPIGVWMRTYLVKEDWLKVLRAYQSKTTLA
jgi:hypothetical protein